VDELSSSELKTILHSRRANLYCLEQCRVLVNGGRVEYVTDAGKRRLYWNIPIANTTCLLLGTGTSITQAAVRELARAGVLLGFCGGGGTPLFAAQERELEAVWLQPQSEYRPTEYLQAVRCRAGRSEIGSPAALSSPALAAAQAIRKRGRILVVCSSLAAREEYWPCVGFA